MGASAWADATSIYERGTTNAWASTDISETEWAGSGGTLEVTTADPIGLKYTSPDNGGGMYTKAITTKDNSKITVNATWYVGSSTGRAGNHNILQLGSLQFRAYGQDQYGGLYDVSGSEAAQIKQFGGKDDVRTSGAWVISLTMDKATGKVTYSVDLPSSADVTGETTLASVSFTNIGIGFTRGGRTGTSNSTLAKIDVLEEEQAVTTANYTVKFLCGETVVKDESVRTGVVGEGITLSDADKAAVIKDGNKYVYASDDSEGKTVTAEGTVVTVNFTEAAKYAYTLNAVDGDGNILKELGSGEQFEGESATVYFNKAINVDGKWYITTYTGNWVFYEAKTENLLFTEDAGITYFFEVEDINKSRDWAATGAYPDRYSNGKAGRLYKGAYAYTDALAGGVYSVTLWGRNQASSSEAAIGMYVRDAEGNETKCVNQFENWGTGGQGTKAIVVEIPDGYSLELKNENADYNSNLEMDYLILRKFDTMTIVGFTTEAGLNDEDIWAPANGIAMTPSEEDPAVWTAVVNNYVISGNDDASLKYYYKAVANGAYGIYELPASGNQDYNFNYDGAGAGKYKLTFTANISANTVELAIEKQATATVYFVNTNNWTPRIWVWDSNNGDYNYTGGVWNDQPTMTLTGEQIDGKDVYTWSTYELNATPNMLIISNNLSNDERFEKPFINGATYSPDGSSTVSKTIGTAGYATFCSASALDFSNTGLTAYIAKKNGTEVSFTAVTKVPANTGVLLKGEAGNYAISTTAEETDDVTGNVLVGVTADTQVAAGSFVLMNGTQGVGFYKAASAFTVGANTAYIEALADGEARSFIGFNFGGETTAIEGVATVKENNGEVYNLQGQRVVKATKGLYIVNGKKVLVK